MRETLQASKLCAQATNLFGAALLQGFDSNICVKQPSWAITLPTDSLAMFGCLFLGLITLEAMMLSPAEGAPHVARPSLPGLLT